MPELISPASAVHLPFKPLRQRGLPLQIPSGTEPNLIPVRIPAFNPPLSTPTEREVMNAREGISPLCHVYIPAEPPLMGLESLKMRFGWPGKLLAGRNVQGFMHF